MDRSSERRANSRPRHYVRGKTHRGGRQSRDAFHSDPKEFVLRLTVILHCQVRTGFGRIECHPPPVQIGSAPLGQPVIVEHLSDRRPVREAQIFRRERDLKRRLLLCKRREGVVLHDPSGVRADRPFGRRSLDELLLRDASDRDPHRTDETAAQAARERDRFSRHSCPRSTGHPLLHGQRLLAARCPDARNSGIESFVSRRATPHS